ncbi:hypothetical protein AVEN_212431-1 [Araneus ventricosus]|uniref:C2H2-type domain-containing protein n=1 Tax=Araneus ventricosus TaxID=182803 RepID=A0A4Y2D0A3_ARAVE|nr:hypothetical protein AVEN_212431-1 [Araneus ventricosus]
MLRLNGTLSMDNSSAQYVEKSSVGKILYEIPSDPSFPNPQRGENFCVRREYERRFAKKCQLTIHSRTHTGETPLNFPICGKAFADNSVLNRDHKAVHNKKKI